MQLLTAQGSRATRNLLLKSLLGSCMRPMMAKKMSNYSPMDAKVLRVEPMVSNKKVYALQTKRYGSRAEGRIAAQ